MSYDKKYKASESNERETPQELFDRLDEEFNFQLDAAASDLNHKVDNYFSIENSALLQTWKPGPAWCNSPWSRDLISKFVAKGFDESYSWNKTIVMLVPTDPSTNWWAGVLKAQAKYLVPLEIRNLKPRIRFLKDGIPMESGVMRPCSLLIFYGTTFPTMGELNKWARIGWRKTTYWNWKTGEYY